MSPLLLLVVAAAPLAPELAEGLRADARLEVVVVAERCTSARCLEERATRERVRYLFFARDTEEDGVVEVRVYDAERKASLARRATRAKLSDTARGLARAALPAESARARVIVLDVDAPLEGPSLGVIASGSFLVVAGVAAAVGGVCGVNTLVLDADAKAPGLTQREANARFDERDRAALCANLGWISAGLTGLLGGAILAQHLGWSE